MWALRLDREARWRVEKIGALITTYTILGVPYVLIVYCNGPQKPILIIQAPILCLI